MLTRMFLVKLPSYIFRWILSQEARLHLWLQHLLLPIAVTDAYRCFADQYPRWANSLFDEYFLAGSAAPIAIPLYPAG